MDELSGGDKSLTLKLHSTYQPTFSAVPLSIGYLSIGTDYILSHILTYTAHKRLVDELPILEQVSIWQSS